jgi:hypothetical protein
MRAVRRSTSPHASRPAHRALAVLASGVLLGGCAYLRQVERPVSPTPPPPAPSVVATVGYDDAVRAGAAYAQGRGYQYALLEALQHGSFWWLRYRVTHEGLEGELSLKVDAATGQLKLLQEGVGSAPAP